MKRSRILATVGLVLAVAALVVMTSGCKKQLKCGCDGDAIDSLKLENVYITYDAVNKTAYFTRVWNPYGTYYFCNPSKWIDELTKYNNGEEILLSGEFFYDCSYVMYSSNSYYNYPPMYQVMVTAVAPHEWGK